MLYWKKMKVGAKQYRAIGSYFFAAMRKEKIYTVGFNVGQYPFFGDLLK